MLFKLSACIPQVNIISHNHPWDSNVKLYNASSCFLGSQLPEPKGLEPPLVFLSVPAGGELLLSAFPTHRNDDVPGFRPSGWAGAAAAGNEPAFPSLNWRALGSTPQATATPTSHTTQLEFPKKNMI